MANVISVSGVDVHIEGDGAETIIMVHGWPDTCRVWDAQVQALKGRYRCVRFTLPGFDAAKARRIYTLDEIVGFLQHLVEQVSPNQKVILMLHDWGCVFGYQFYLRHPQLVSKIIGVDIGDLVSMQKSITIKAGLMTVAYQVWLALAWIAGGRIGDWMTRSMARSAHCPSDEAHMSSCMAYPYYLQWFGGRQSYRHLVQSFEPACPFLFIYGRRKPFMFHAQAWVEGVRAQEGNQVVEFDTGHWVMCRQPERFNQVVGDWLTR
jgi:pimeloyl-ACP methyl ester carboxylesterase